jgi:hypothetical protein
MTGILTHTSDHRAPGCCDLSGGIASDGSHESPVGIRVEPSIDGPDVWFAHCLEDQRESVELRLPETDAGRANIVRFEIVKQLLYCHLGNWVLTRFPMRVASLPSRSSLVPDEESSHDRLFAYILTRKLDAIYLDSVKPESLLWRYLQSSPLIQKSFRFYSQQGPRPHSLIRLNGSFNNYLKRFSPKTRKNRLREINILRKLGDVKLIRVTEASEIDAFLKAAYGISQKTWQFKRFGWSIAARDPRLVKNELLRLARDGSLRSYLLTCGGVTCSFILGQQSGSRFHPVAAGVDPAWRDYSVGTVLLMFVLEDLFKENSPEFYDLGTCAKSRQYLATDSYSEANVWLFRRRPYPALTSSIYRACNLTSSVGGIALERFGLKGTLTQLVRWVDLLTSKTPRERYSETPKWGRGG